VKGALRRRLTRPSYNGELSGSIKRVEARQLIPRTACAFCKVQETHFFEYGIPVCRRCLDITFWHEAGLTRRNPASSDYTNGLHSPVTRDQSEWPSPGVPGVAVLHPVAEKPLPDQSERKGKSLCWHILVGSMVISDLQVPAEQSHFPYSAKYARASVKAERI
jgi:hypothetical protein